MNEEKKHVIIVGAGIVGVSTAIWLQRDGHSVTLVDKLGPAEGASYGNAGLLASSSIVPVTTPGLISKAPKMLLDPNQPLFLRYSYLPKLLPFLFKYLRHANVEANEKIAAAMTPIVGDSLADHQALAQGTEAEKWIVPGDYVFAYKDRAHFESDAFGWNLRRKHGFEFEELDGEAYKTYDPHIGPGFQFGVRLANHGRLTDPGRYVKDLAAHVEKQGGSLIKAEVTDVIHENGHATGVLTKGGQTLSGDTVVVALGAWSGPLTKKLGIDVPMESERGYHVELYEPSFTPTTPTMITTGKFLMTPMEGRLRLAGVVEFGGLDAPPSRGPFDLLRRNIQEALPGLTWKEEKEWMGHRPAPADSIPIIGETPEVKSAYLGFGHHHVGMTGGPKTGRLLAQVIQGRTPNVDMTPYSPARFK